MIKEWKNEFNSFNSHKGLLYSNWYQSIRDWKDGKIKAPIAPVEASFDLIHACNLHCEHCNAHKYLEEKVEQMYRLPDEHIKNLIEFLGQWGVKGNCFGGGGEPTLHTYLPDALYLSIENNIQPSVVTNGTLLNKGLIEAISLTCRWLGISVDAATSNTYKIGRKADLFTQAIDNVQKACVYMKEHHSKCEVAFKFLIFNYNQYEIYEACKLAKELGVRDFHARPADYTHQGMGELANKIGSYDVDVVLEQFERCHELEDEHFRVFTIVHKFDSNFKPRKDFSQCYASPCCIQICANGIVYLCPDTRHLDFYKLGNHYPNPEEISTFWGNQHHYDLVFKTGKSNCTTRCTFAPYCKQCEELFIKDTDPMCKWFI